MCVDPSDSKPGRDSRVSRHSPPDGGRGRRQREQTGRWKPHRVRNETSEISTQTKGQNWTASWRTATKLTKSNLYDPLKPFQEAEEEETLPQSLYEPPPPATETRHRHTQKRKGTEQSALGTDVQETLPQSLYEPPPPAT